MECRAPQSVLPINLRLYLSIKRNSFTFVQITILCLCSACLLSQIIKKEIGSSVYQKSIGLRRALEGYMKHQTSISISKKLYFYFRELQLLQKITISKTVLYISENYNQQNRSLHLRKLQSAKPFSTSQKIRTSNNHSKKKPQEREKGSRKKRK